MFLLDQNYQETDLGTLPLLSIQRGIVRIFGSCRLKCLGSRQGLVLVFFFVIAASSDVLENVLWKCAGEAQALSYTDCTLQMYLQLFFPQRKQNSICIFTEEDHAVVTL